MRPAHLEAPPVRSTTVGRPVLIWEFWWINAVTFNWEELVRYVYPPVTWILEILQKLCQSPVALVSGGFGVTQLGWFPVPELLDFSSMGFSGSSLVVSPATVPVGGVSSVFGFHGPTGVANLRCESYSTVVNCIGPTMFLTGTSH